MLNTNIEYTGSPKGNTSTIPTYLQTIIDRINGEALQLNTKIDQVVVNRYSDNEPAIKPESQIFTVTVGEQAPIKFKDQVTGREETLSPADWSLYVMSKSSQYYWTHQMEEIDLGEQWRNVACWRPSAPTAPPFLAPLPHLKSKAKLNKLSYFRKYATKIYKNVCF